MDEAETLCDRVAIMDHGKIIALDSPRGLIGTVGAGNVIEFAVAGGEAPPSRDTLLALPGVRDVRMDDGSVALIAEHVHLAVPALLGTLDRQHASLSMLTTHHATLEDVFVSLTGRHLRDD